MNRVKKDLAKIFNDSNDPHGNRIHQRLLNPKVTVFYSQVIALFDKTNFEIGSKPALLWKDYTEMDYFMKE